MNTRTSIPTLPERIHRLEDLAYNLWWTWNRGARDLWRNLDARAWEASRENPVLLLATLPAETLDAAAADPDFLRRYDAVLAELDRYLDEPRGWFSAQYGPARDPLAYLSAEYGLHPSLPIYAGGLGILAGDHLKECSDLGVPVVAVGLRYTNGYVTQRVGDDGRPQDLDRPLDHRFDPITPLLDADGQPLLVEIPRFDPPVWARVWKANVGRVPLYLLDPDVEQNRPEDRTIARTLYTNNLEERLRQEIVLGMGGMRLLDALGRRPAAIHINEGHPGFAIVERIRAAVALGRDFDEALDSVRATSIFTTHTPLAAGTDVFPWPLMEKYFGNQATLGLDPESIFRLGVNPRDPGAGFNLTVFALRAADYRNAVSQRHGEVARGLWSFLWPDRAVEDVPIDAITNGVHLPTWVAPSLQARYDDCLGPTWADDQAPDLLRKRIERVPDATIWRAHQELKAALLDDLVERAREHWQRDRVAFGNVLASGILFDRETLTLGFARRFTGYKRPDLLLTDLDRLARLLTDSRCPVQIVFAGKAHPADLEGKRLIQEIVHLAQDPAFAGRIAFVEEYDQTIAQRLVSGVDVWLNTPLPPLEASGTSGMKAALNGVPQLSILDGWWIEGYDGTNGWGFGQDGASAAAERKASDAAQVYELLETRVVPLYYQRGDDGIPHDFVKVMKAAIAGAAPRFGTRRMVKEYVTRCYLPALNPSAMPRSQSAFVLDAAGG